LIVDAAKEGSAVSGTNSGPGPAAAAEGGALPDESVVAQPGGKQEEPEKIGWWLTFFIVIVCFVGGILGFVLSLAIIGFSSNVSLLHAFGAMVASLSAGYFLAKKKPFAVSFVNVFLASNLAASIWYSGIGFTAYTRPSGCCAPFVMPLAWLVYFALSKNVKSVYGALKESPGDRWVWPGLAVLFAFLSPFLGLGLSLVAMYRMLGQDAKGLLAAVLALVIAGAFILAPPVLEAMHPVTGELRAECFAYCIGDEGGQVASSVVIFDWESGKYFCACFDKNINIVGSSYIEP
jgi:hypothetical protein